MSSNYWAKVFIEMLDDRKTATLPDSSWRRFVECILLAKELDEGGFLPSVVDMAWRLRIDATALSDDLTRLALAGLLELREGDRWFVTNFTKRQEGMTATERGKRHRWEKAKPDNDPFWRMAIYKPLPNASGIYMISFAGTDQAYIGSSKDIQRRVQAHLTEMTSVRHFMYECYRVAGPAGIAAQVLEESPEDELVTREQYWMDQYQNKLTLINTEAAAKRHYRRNDTSTNSLIEKRREEKNREEGETERAAPATPSARPAPKKSPPPSKVQTRIPDRTPPGFQATSGYHPPPEPDPPEPDPAQVLAIGEMANAITDVTGISARLNWSDPKGNGNSVGDLAADLVANGYTPEQIRAHYGQRKVAEQWHWYEMDWRGKPPRSERPSIKAIRETIAGAVSWRPAGQVQQENGGQSWVERSIELARRNGLLPQQQPQTGQ